MKETAVELPTDPRLVEISVKVAEVGKVSFTLETKKDVTKTFKRAVEIGLRCLEKELEKFVEDK